MTNATLIKYAEIVKAEKELAEKKEVLKAKIVEDFGKDKIDKLECDFKTLSIISSRLSKAKCCAHSIFSR